MSKVKSTNEFYTGVYTKLGMFASSPYTWSIINNKNDQSDASWLIWLMTELPLKVVLSPVLLPATAITCALAVISAVIVGLAYLATLAGAAMIDTITHDAPSPQGKNSKSF